MGGAVIVMLECSGLIRGYKANRPLSNEERREQLYQGRSLRVDSLYEMAVIRMNSSFMEMVDKYYSFKGVISFVAIFFLVGVLFFIRPL